MKSDFGHLCLNALAPYPEYIDVTSKFDAHEILHRPNGSVFSSPHTLKAKHTFAIGDCYVIFHIMTSYPLKKSWDFPLPRGKIIFSSKA